MTQNGSYLTSYIVGIIQHVPINFGLPLHYYKNTRLKLRCLIRIIMTLSFG